MNETLPRHMIIKLLQIRVKQKILNKTIKKDMCGQKNKGNEHSRFSHQKQYIQEDNGPIYFKY